MEFSLLPSGKPAFSVELFPPKDALGEERLWSSLNALASFSPDFASVTYGAGGSTRDRTIRVTAEITARTNINTVAHLTCVGSTAVEIDDVLAQYKSAGITTILALRGDPSGGPRAPWVSTPGGFDHADQLVERAIERGFTVGVAAFPDGHPASNGGFEEDVNVLVRKYELGAEFATTQFFFDAERYLQLRDRLINRGVTMPLIAGILPITNFKQLVRMAELSGTDLPSRIVERISELQDDATALRDCGIDIAVELGQRLIEEGVPGLHFYTMNSATATTEIIARLGLRP